MANAKNDREFFKLMRVQGFHDLELMKAKYRTHVFPRHWNETFVVQLVEQGVNEFYCARATHKATAGSVVLINPHEVHTGCSIGEVPLVYRTYETGFADQSHLHRQFKRIVGITPGQFAA